MLTEAWRILRLRGQPALMCLVCDTVSFHLEDVQQKYCSACNLFLDEVPDTFRRPPRAVRNLPGWQVDLSEPGEASVG